MMFWHNAAVFGLAVSFAMIGIFTVANLNERSNGKIKWFELIMADLAPSMVVLFAGHIVGLW
jgi:hypothetical protein